MVDPIIVSLVAKTVFYLLTSDTKCSKCHNRATKSVTQCCKTPMCDICISGSVSKKGLFRKVSYFNCPFCAKTVELKTV